MTSDPEGNCAVAQAVFSEVQNTYKQTGHIPAQVAVPGPGGTVIRLSCVVLVPADEVTCTSPQYDAQLLLSAVGAKPPSGY